MLGQAVDAGDGVAHHFSPLGHRALGRIRRLGGGLGMLFHFLGRGRQLLHRRRHLVDLFPLQAHAASGLFHYRGVVLGDLLQVVRRLGDAPDDRAVAPFQKLARQDQIPQLVVAAGIDPASYRVVEHGAGARRLPLPGQGGHVGDGEASHQGHDQSQAHLPQGRAQGPHHQAAHEGQSHLAEEDAGAQAAEGLEQETVAPRSLPVQGSVEALGALHPGTIRGHAHRLVTGDLAVLEDGGDEGVHPVVIPVLAAVLHHPHPCLALLDGVPQVLEGGGGHVRVADDVVGLLQQLLLAETGYPAEILVGRGDAALGVGGGDDVDVARVTVLAPRDGQVFLHGSLALWHTR